MGSYIYRVTAKTVVCSDGKPANIAIYAYKPYRSFNSAALNTKMHFRSGCVASEALEKKGKLSGRFVLGRKADDGKISAESGAKVYEYGAATFVDDAVDSERLPALEGVTVK